MSDGHKIVIMNYTTPPSLEDLEGMAQAHLDNLPDELADYCEDLVLVIEDLPDESIENDLDLDTPFDILALFKNGAEITPGVLAKQQSEDDRLILFRRPILDYWCESYEDLNFLIRQIIINELGQNFDLSDEEIEDLVLRDSDLDCAPA